ncbi:MAG TPA: undecaprenyl-phosphate alpha-N-acetylglucosaminyl 1-phosphate transferase, partial [Clostridiales bacterium]|nr:undecaprenyl-phosphate alpha-N-acetylglucosaminyl 1-phosphate transferase [Clostridiales bacterium]
MLSYLMGFLAAAAVGFVVTPVIRRMAIRLDALDRPVGRSVHKRAVPHLGGLAIYLAFAAGALVTSGIGSRDVRAILFGGLLVLGLGMIDDFR